MQTAALIVLILVLTAAAFAAGQAYDRHEWRHWLDVPDRPCRSVRQAVLARDAQPGTVEWSPEGCFVLKGEWREPYDARGLVHDPKALDVDHLIPLGWAATHGGQAWSRERKAAYANFLGYRWHLLAVNLSANRQKGDKGPEAWVPENVAFYCRYGESWATVLVLWKLDVPEATRAAIAKLVETC